MAVDPIKLVRSIPPSIDVRDPEAQRVLSALTEAIRYLVTSGTFTKPAAVQNPVTIEGTDPIAVDSLPNSLFRISFTGSLSGGGGQVYLGGKSIELHGITFELDGDESSPGNDKLYGTNGSGTKEWVAIPVVEAASPGASVTTLGAGSEGSETAATDTWTAGGANGLAEWYVSRVVYAYDGNKILYAMLRMRTYDNTGKLYSVSAETRVSVDVSVAES